MAYVDPVNNVPYQDGVVGSPNNYISLGTSTASGNNTFTGTAGSAAGNGTFNLPKAISATLLSAIRVRIGTAPATNLTSLTLTFKNGTNTIGQVTVGTHTAGESVDAVMTALSTDSHGVVTGGQHLAAGDEPIIVVTASATASAMALGSYAIDVVRQGWGQ